MIQITIQINGDKITVNQSATPTKVEQNNKKFFIVLRDYGFSHHIEFVSDNYIEAVTYIKLKSNIPHEDDDYNYKLFVQTESGNIIPYNNTNWDR